MDINTIKKLAKDIQTNASVYFVQNPKTDKFSHCEIRMIDNDKLANRGYIIYRKKDKIYNGELFDNVIIKILNKFFTTITIKDETLLDLKLGTLKSKTYNFEIEVKKFIKKVEFKYNGEKIFTLRLVKIGNEYVQTQPAINKAYDAFEQFLQSVFTTNIEDFKTCRDIIGAIDTYLSNK